MSIRLLVTGGTFDKEYDEGTATLVFRNSHVDDMLRQGRCGVGLETEVLMMVDSLDMTTAQRQSIVEACRRCSEARIVITHGTDTLVETAQAIAGAVEGKTIILTGA